MTGVQLTVTYCFLIIIIGTIIYSLLEMVVKHLISKINIKKIDITITKEEQE